MIKLIRNSLATVSHLIDADGQSVKWAYIQALDALQREEGLRLGNKLTKTHRVGETKNEGPTGSPSTECFGS